MQRRNNLPSAHFLRYNNRPTYIHSWRHLATDASPASLGNGRHDNLVVSIEDGATSPSGDSELLLVAGHQTMLRLLDALDMLHGRFLYSHRD